MKSILREVHWLTLLSGTVGVLLRFCLLLEGTDEKGLYPAGHFSWTCLVIFSAVVLVALLLTLRYVAKSRRYLDNFPASIWGALGFVAGAIGLLLTGLQGLDSANVLIKVQSIVAIPAAAGLVAAGWSRFRGEKVHFLVYLLPCLFFGLHLFAIGRTYGNEPEESRFMLGFIASAAAVIAFYQLWGYAVDMGNRVLSLFFSLSAVYLCMIAAPGSPFAVLYVTTAACLFLNLCPRRLPSRRAPIAPESVPETPSDPILSETTDLQEE